MNPNPNIIYDDQIVKYTINIPIAMYSEITRKAHKRQLPRSVWIRHALDRAIVNERPMTMTELLRYEDRGQIYQCPDPPRRYHGFLGGLTNGFKLNWFWGKRRVYLDAQNNN